MDSTLFLWVLLCNRRGLEIFQQKFASLSTRRYRLVALVKSGQMGLTDYKTFLPQTQIKLFGRGAVGDIACFKIFLVIRKLHNTTPQKQHCIHSNGILNFSYNQCTVVIYHIRLFYQKSATSSCIMKLYSNKMPSQIFSPIKHCTSGILALVVLLSTLIAVLHQLKSSNCTLCKKKRNQRNY